MFAYLHGQKSYYIVVRIQWRKEHKIPVMYDICVPVIVAHNNVVTNNTHIHIHTQYIYIHTYCIAGYGDIQNVC